MTANNHTGGYVLLKKASASATNAAYRVFIFFHNRDSSCRMGSIAIITKAADLRSAASLIVIVLSRVSVNGLNNRLQCLAQRVI